MEFLQELKKVKINEVRAVIPKSCYERSNTKALAWYAFDGLLYLSMIAGVFLSPYWPLKFLFGVLAGCAVAFMFVWAHDAAHGALFKSKRASEILGTIFMLPSLNMYRLWCFGHNKVHHGFTSWVEIDFIWRPLSPQEYTALPFHKRFFYRLERTPYFCALHYLVHVWWKKMVRFAPDGNPKEKRLFRLNKLLTLAFFTAFFALAYQFGGGLVGAVCAVIIPFIVFNYFIALFVYLHHTHPDSVFFKDKKDWSMTLGQLYSTTVVRCSKLSEALIHNILIHIPHHVDSRIPFYHLKEAYAALKEQYGEYLHEYRFSIKTVSEIFRRCKLYDYENMKWISFKEVSKFKAASKRMQESLLEMESTLKEKYSTQ
jgi:omega-6 fatty acid desaturase (delta-12 desaturase)